MKDGFSMQEIEQFGRTHKQTILFSVILLLSAVMNTILWDSLSIWLIALGGIAGMVFPEHIGNFLLKMAGFFGKLEKTVKMICAGVAIALSIIFPPLFFLTLGLVAGVAIKRKAHIMRSEKKEMELNKPKVEEQKDKNDNKPSS